MKDRHVLHELSAYLDGEAYAPDRIEAHLAVCAGCAARYRQLKTTSQALRNLPRPELIKGFETDVISRIRSGPELQRRRQNRHIARYACIASALAAACIVIMTAVLHRDEAPVVPLKVTRQVPQHEPATLDVLWEIGDVALGSEVLDPGAAEIEADENTVTLALSEGTWLCEALEDWQGDQDIDELISSLDEAEKVAFEQLLHAYSREGAQI